MRSQEHSGSTPRRSPGLWCAFALLLLLAAGGAPLRGALPLPLPASHRLVDDSVVVALSPLRSPSMRGGSPPRLGADDLVRVLARWRSIAAGGLPAPRAPDA